MKKYNNYIVLALFLLLTIIILVYALKWHEVYENNRNNVAIISEYINELNPTEFNNYINENRDAVIYFGIPNNEACRAFESKFKKDIKKYNLSDVIVYLNVSDLSEDNLTNTLDKTYSNKDLRADNKYLSEVPALGIYRDAKLVDFVKGSKLTRDSAVKILKEYDVIEDGS